MTRRTATPDPDRLTFARRLQLPQTPIPWGMTDVLLMLVVLFLALMLVASGVAVAIAGAPNVLTPTALLIGWSAGALLVIAYVVISRRRTPEDRQSLRLEAGLLPLPLLLLLGVAFGATIDLLAAALSGNFGRLVELRGVVVTDVGQMALAFIFTGILAPIAFGLAFTGVIMPALRVRFGALPGLLLTIILFTITYFLVFGATSTGTERLWYGAFVPCVTFTCVALVRIRAASTRAAIVAWIGAGIIGVVLMIAAG